MDGLPQGKTIKMHFEMIEKYQLHDRSYDRVWLVDKNRINEKTIFCWAYAQINDTVVIRLPL